MTTGSGERQQTVSNNALDHSAIRTGPGTYVKRSQEDIPKNGLQNDLWKNFDLNRTMFSFNRLLILALFLRNFPKFLRSLLDLNAKKGV